MQAECTLHCFKETTQKNTDVWGPHLDHRSSGSIPHRSSEDRKLRRGRACGSMRRAPLLAGAQQAR